MAITKNKQSDETIHLMAKKAFPEKTIETIMELTEGMCNVCYDVSFQDGFSSILKITSKDRTGNTSNEINLMSAEVKAMSLVSDSSLCKVPIVYYYDPSKEICDGDYFFMEKLPGDNFYLVKDHLEENTISVINEEIGVISSKLTKIQSDFFGFLGDEKRYESLYAFTRVMLENLIQDAEKREIDIVYDRDFFLSQLEKDKAAFSGIFPATLVHWDLWEGNVFIKDGHITGIIDWERAVFGEAFMDDRFRYHNKDKNFLKGFGKSSFTIEEETRLKWYDTILYLTMMIEVFYREYEEKGQYTWAKEMLLSVWKMEVNPI